MEEENIIDQPFETELIAPDDIPTNLIIYRSEICKHNNLQENKGNVKEEDRPIFVYDLNKENIAGSQIDEFVMKEMKAEDTKRHKIKLFKTHSMNADQSNRINKEQLLVADESKKEIKENFDLSGRCKDYNEIPIKYLESYEILKKIKTQRRNHSSKVGTHKIKIINLIELDQSESDEKIDSNHKISSCSD